MSIKQLSIFLENKSGRVAEVTKKLASSDININALVLSDTTDFGVLRLIVNNADKAYEVLKNNGFVVSLTDVIIVPMSYETGSLSKVLEVLEDAKVCIEYMYAFLGKKEGEAFSVFRIEDSEQAIKILENNNIKRLTESQL